MKTFLLIDDHVIIRSGIKGLLSEIFKASKIDEAGDEDTAVEKLKHYPYDLVMMDVKLLKTETLALMEFIHVTYPAAKVLIFSMRAENIYARRFLSAGAMGFISKEAHLDEITRAVNLVLSGGRYTSESTTYFPENGSLPKKTV